MKRIAEDNTKQTVNYGTGSGTCDKCLGPIEKGVLRVGKWKVTRYNDRGESGGHMKYTHIECFRTTPINCEGRASKWLSSIKTRYEGFDSLRPKDQQRIINLAQRGRVPSVNAVSAWSFLIYFKKYQNSIFKRLPDECGYLIAEFISNQKCPHLHSKKEIVLDKNEKIMKNLEPKTKKRRY